MPALLHLLLALVFDRFKSRRRLEIENLYLRHQLNIAMRKASKRLRLRGVDRAFMVWMTRLWPDLLNLSRVVRPDTIMRWHRAGFRAYWRWKSRGRSGRPRISGELRELVRRMSRENRLWGAPRIHGELLKLGFEVAESTVSKYMIRHRGPPSQTWRTFLRNHADAIAAIDLCVVHTATFDRLFARIWAWTRTLHFPAQHSDLVPLSAFQSCPDYTTATRGHDFWEAQVIENKGSGMSLIQDLQRDDIHPIAIKPEADKIMRMLAQTPAIEAGSVLLPKRAGWLQDFQQELMAFPSGRHNDQVDALSQALKVAKSWTPDMPVFGRYGTV